MFCSECGNPVRIEAAAFCDECGSPLLRPNPAVAEAQRASDPGLAEAQPAPGEGAFGERDSAPVVESQEPTPIEADQLTQLAGDGPAAEAVAPPAGQPDPIQDLPLVVDSESVPPASRGVLHAEPGDSQDETPAVTAKPAPANGRRLSRPKRILIGVAAVSLISVGLVGAGVAVGMGWAARQDVANSEAELLEIPVPDYSEGSVAAMPDVRGLDEGAARAALTDSGIPVSVLSVVTRGAAGAAGVVVEQSPAFGTSQPKSVELVVSERATVPDVIGKSEADAYTALRELGARVEALRKYVPGIPPGQAVKLVPGVGSKLTESVKLYISEAATSAYLNTLPVVSGSCSSGAASVDGTKYDQALSCSAGAEQASVEWNLARKVDELTATVGVPDDGPRGAAVQVEVIADGKRVGRALTAGFGHPVNLHARLTGALRLELRIRGLGLDANTYESYQAVLADARLSGSTDAMALLNPDQS